MRTRVLNRLDGTLLESYRERITKGDGTCEAEIREHLIHEATWLVTWVLDGNAWRIMRAEDAPGRSNGVEKVA